MPRALLFAAFAALSILPTAQAQESGRFERDCREWIDRRGYSPDYIEQRTGLRQAGMGRNWRPNTELKDLAAGDVVLQGIDSTDGRGQRVAIVEAVLRHPDGSIRAVRVSEMNLGKMVEPRCHVTENFGKVTTRTIPVDRLRSAWRPEK